MLRGPEDSTGIWKMNMDALTAFLSIDSQFRMTGTGQGGLVVCGLDYQGVQAGFALSGRMVTPELWDDIRMIEAGAVAALNKGRMQ